MELKDGDDPETVCFTSVPIWTQFRNIPYFLLSKKLARDLGSRIGELICIDNFARGDIGTNFVGLESTSPLIKHCCGGYLWWMENRRMMLLYMSFMRG